MHVTYTWHARTSTRTVQVTCIHVHQVDVDFSLLIHGPSDVHCQLCLHRSFIKIHLYFTVLPFSVVFRKSLQIILMSLFVITVKP